MNPPVWTVVVPPPLSGQSGLPVGLIPRLSSGPDGQTVLLWLAVATVLIAAVCGASYAVTRAVQHRRRFSHAALFGQLCRLHGLDRSGRSLLRRLAVHHGLLQPARLFVDPQWLDPARLPAALAARKGELVALRNRLFGQPEPQSPAG